jgi:hypothetical protein
MLVSFNLSFSIPSISAAEFLEELATSLNLFSKFVKFVKFDATVDRLRISR